MKIELTNYDDNEIADKVAGKQSLITTLNERIASLNKEIAELNKIRADLLKQEAEFHISKPILLDELAKLNDEKTKLTVEVEQAKAFRDDLKNQSISYETAIEKLSARHDSLTKMVSSLPVVLNQYEEAKQQTAILESEIAQYKAIAAGEQIRAIKVKEQNDETIRALKERESAVLARETEAAKQLLIIQAMKSELKKAPVQSSEGDDVPVKYRRFLQKVFAEKNIRLSEEKLFTDYINNR